MKCQYPDPGQKNESGMRRGLGERRQYTSRLLAAGENVLGKSQQTHLQGKVNWYLLKGDELRGTVMD